MADLALKGSLCIHVSEREWKQSDSLHAKVLKRLYSSIGLAVADIILLREFSSVLPHHCVIHL